MVTGDLVNRFSNFCVLVSCFSKFSFLRVRRSPSEMLEPPMESMYYEYQLLNGYLTVVLKGVIGLVVRVAYSPAGTTLTFSIARLV